MRWLTGILVIAALAGIVVWHNRLDVLMWAAPVVAGLLDPVDPNQPVPWPEGPARATLPPLQRPPNVVLILADDLGFNDVSFFNGGAADGTLMTPGIDSLAREGVVFANGYAANAVCAPSRASIMTGRYATRFGFEYTPFFRIGATFIDLMRDDDPQALQPVIHHDRLEALPPMEQLGMPPAEITLAELLRGAGYYTAHIGKWHLGSTGGMRPEDQGFANSLYMAGMSYLPEDSPEVVNARQPFDPIDRMVWASARYAAQFDGSHSFEPDGYLTDYYTAQAVEVIRANRHRPFLLYLAHWGIHNPLQARRSDYEALDHIGDHRLRVYGAMIRALDRGVGEVLRALEEHGLSDDTLVIFTSDNGGAGYLGLPDVNAPYRGWKLTHFEGGTHVPFFFRWPRRIEPGTVFEAPVSHLDLFSTIAAAAGVRLPDDRTIDGVDLLPYVRGESDGVPHRSLFWRQGYLRTVLHDGWKLMVSERPAKRWLFHLDRDPTEQRNLARSRPDKVSELLALLAAHDAAQAEPAWPSVVEAPVLVDKTAAQRFEPGDEYVYWPN